MIPTALDSLTAHDIRSLIENEVREDRTIEYKRELPGGTDSDKKEFLADVSSFANAAGGDLIFGISAESGVPVSAPGLAGFDEDKEYLRLSQIIRSGLSQPIPSFHFRTVEDFSEGPILILRIARSWRGPHMITYKSSPKFFSRGSKGKVPMDITEIRAAFESAGDIPKRIREWRNERLGLISADEGPLPLLPRRCIVLHAMPTEATSDTWRFSVEEIAKVWKDLRPLSGGFGGYRFNLDGVLTYSSYAKDQGRGDSYAQLFRSGAIETATNDFANGDETYLYRIDREIVEAVSAYVAIMKELAIEPPIALLLSILGAKGLRAVHGHSRSPHVLDRDSLIMPDLLLEKIDSNIPRLMRPIIDALWNSFGFDKSYSYDSEGSWRPKD